MLEQEARALGQNVESVDTTGVEFKGSSFDAMRLNLESRIAMRVLTLVKRFRCEGPDQLKRMVGKIEWDTIIPAGGYLSVTSTVHHPSIDNTMFASLLVKDAIVDRIRSVHGRRPDSGPLRTGAVVHLHWHGDSAGIWIDTSGQKLSDRGYRKMPHAAPLRETLAAAILLRTGWTKSAPLVIPMCGSGTLAIEAALMAAGRPPGLLRSQFAFQHLHGFNSQLWADLRRDVTPRKPRRGRPERPTIIATDHDPQAVEATRRNAETAGVGHMIETAVCDFADTPLPDTPGHIILHPEYGLRLGDEAALQPVYKRMGDFFKQQCGGWSGWIFTGNLKLAKSVGLKTACRVPMRHAKVDARLLGYELWAGSRERSEAAS